MRERLFPFEWGGDVVSKSDNSAAIAKFKLFQASRFGVGNSNKTKVDPSLELALSSTTSAAKNTLHQALPALEGVILDGVLYRRGLMLSPKTTLEYVVSDVGQTYSAIRGFVGVDDRLKPNGRAKLTIDVDGKPLCELELRGTDKVKSLRYELPKTNNKKITITADFADKITEPIPIGIGDLKLIK
jgi:hypothetical protein